MLTCFMVELCHIMLSIIMYICLCMFFSVSGDLTLHKGIENDNTNGLLLAHVLNLESINNSANRVIHACA
jgi:hypothetical protein